MKGKKSFRSGLIRSYQGKVKRKNEKNEKMRIPLTFRFFSFGKRKLVPIGSKRASPTFITLSSAQDEALPFQHSLEELLQLAVTPRTGYIPLHFGSWHAETRKRVLIVDQPIASSSVTGMHMLYDKLANRVDSTIADPGCATSMIGKPGADTRIFYIWSVSRCYCLNLST